MSLSNTPVYHNRTKHIEFDGHFISEKIVAGMLAPIYVKTTDQLADLFTKTLPSPLFHHLLGKMKLLDIHYPQTHLEGSMNEL